MNSCFILMSSESWFIHIDNIKFQLKLSARRFIISDTWDGWRNVCRNQSWQENTLFVQSVFYGWVDLIQRCLWYNCSCNVNDSPGFPSSHSKVRTSSDAVGTKPCHTWSVVSLFLRWKTRDRSDSNTELRASSGRWEEVRVRTLGGWGFLVNDWVATTTCHPGLSLEKNYSEVFNIIVFFNYSFNWIQWDWGQK